jgi:DNA mismatch endonuclease (patch repair protein)
MRGNRKRDTSPEVALRAELHHRGRRFRKNAAISVDGVRVSVDILFPSVRVAVFVDGCFWHGCERHGTSPRINGGYWAEKLAGNRARDARNNQLLGDGGWAVVRVWEHDVLARAADTVETALASRARQVSPPESLHR